MNAPHLLPEHSRPARHVAVVGGGIAGLAAAHRLRELNPAIRVTLLEASSRLGGMLRTERRDGFLLEHSADNFLTNVPWAVDLCRRIGIGDELIETNSLNRRALVVDRGQLKPIPEGFLLLAPRRIMPVLKSPLLSWRGKLRLACERFVAARRDGIEESLTQFARRRLGRETFERIVQPLVGGIYTADPDKLSVAATLPRFVDMERDFGSLARGMKQNQGQAAASESGAPETGARYSMFVAPRDGMSSLVEAIAAKILEKHIQLESPVEHIAPLAGNRWRLRYARGAYRQSEVHDFDALVLATPVRQTARLLETVDTQAAADLAGIESASSAVVTLGYRRDQISHPLDGFGFVVPAIENRRIFAASFASNKFAFRAPDGCASIRVFLGGALQSELLAHSDDTLQQIAREELAELIGATGDPILSGITRWHDAMPQYHVGHAARINRIRERIANLPGLALAGNVYHGVGIPNCIHSGEQAAETVVAALAPLPTATER